MAEALSGAGSEDSLMIPILNEIDALGLPDSGKGILSIALARKKLLN